MKSTLKNRPLLHIRPLKPKATYPMQFAQVQALSFDNDQDRTTLLHIYPSNITLKSSALLEAIEEKKDYIAVAGNLYVLLKDVLIAIYNHQMAHDSNKPSKNSQQSDTCLASAEETKRAKRPANSFLFYTVTFRKKVRKLFPCFTNSDVSKILGAMWKHVTGEEKDKYIKLAIECRRKHKERYPDFEYNIKRDTRSFCQLPDTQNDQNKWDEYFNWCLLNGTTESATGVLTAESRYKPGEPLTFDLGVHGDRSLHCSNVNDMPLHDSQDLIEWNQVCDIVSRFFPNDSGQNTIVDEQLWSNIDSLDLFNDEGSSMFDYSFSMN